MLHIRLVGSIGILALFVLTGMGAAQDQDPRDSLDEVRGMLLHHSPGDYWLGIACGLPSTTLRSHLALQDRTGLVIHRVFPGSPADRSGLQKHDVIMKFGGIGVGTVQQLTQVIDQRKQKETPVTVIRHGQEQTVLVVPAKRKVDAAGAGNDHRDAGQVLRWLDEINQDAKRGFENSIQDNALRFLFFHPGTVLPAETDRLGIKIPRDLKIVVTSPDGGPARILFEKDGESWEWSTDNLDRTNLPVEVKRYVDFFLGPVQPSSSSVKKQAPARELPEVECDADTAVSAAETGEVHDRSGRDGIEKKLKTMEEQLLQLREQLQQLTDDTGKSEPVDSRSR